MKRFTLILSGTFALQLALALGLTFSGSGNDAYRADEPLLAFEKDKVDEIAIAAGDGNSVTLKKRDGVWIIPAFADFPAAGDRVAGFLDKLADMKKGWPVAKTPEASRRFRLTDDDHERRIVLKSGDKTLDTLYIGVSPTFKQTHVRAGDAAEIHSATIAAYEAGARGEEWLDKDQLDLPQDKISSISIGDVLLEKRDGSFTLAGLGEGETVKAVELPPIIRAVTKPSFDAIQGKGEVALAKLKPADFEVTVKRSEGEPVVLTFKKEADGGAYLFASSSHPYVFRVAASTIKPLTEVKRERLVELTVKQEAKPEDAKPEDNPEAKGEQPPQSQQPNGTGG